MTKEQLKIPKRVWINEPSTLQPDHKYHGKIGIAFHESFDSKFVRIFFTEGPIHSMQIDPLYLSPKN